MKVPALTSAAIGSAFQTKRTSDFAAKPITTVTNSRPAFVSNTPVQAYRAPPTAFAHPMPAAAFVRPAATPMKKP